MVAYRFLLCWCFIMLQLMIVTSQVEAEARSVERFAAMSDERVA